MLRLTWLAYLSSFLSGELVKSPSCGYDSCHPLKDGLINVHIVAHTHDDVGWIKTVDQYYYDRKNPNDGGVKQILTSVYNSLRKNIARRFIYVESAFLFKWWREQNPRTQMLFKRLVNNGQLELVSGGWSMNDEATTNYQSIIDQFTLGLSKINNTFGACGRPKVGWQIDPFGHSSEMASIFANLGFDGLFLGRIDYQDKRERFKTKTAEMLWQGSKSQGKKSEIFTSVLYNIYQPPEGFCFDQLCEDTFNASEEEKWANLMDFMNEEARVYKTKNIILTMGGDFHYVDAEAWFSNLDKLIEHGNGQQSNGSKYNFIYSTPSCYLKAVRDEAEKTQITWPVKTDDFFPYASEESTYWTGFYTSRPTHKRFERLGNNFLQICKQLYVLGNLDHSYIDRLESLRRAMGVLQHHDAISGTEQQHVANDYAKQLSTGLEHCNAIASAALNNLLPNVSLLKESPKFPYTSCLLANISQCELSESFNSVVVTIYNPLSRPVNNYIRIPVTEGWYLVKGPKGERPALQMVPIPEQVLLIPGRKSLATMELIFYAASLPPLGFKSYYIKKISSSNKKTQSNATQKKLSVIISKPSGLLSKVITNGKPIPIRQEFLYYKANFYGPRPSGAYISNPRTKAVPVTTSAAFTIYQGELVTEVHQVFNDLISQVIKLYQKENFIEFQWLVGLYPDREGREFISRFTTELKTNSTFFTDSNGREILKRVRNFRPTWELYSTRPIPENYYPVTSKILIRDPVADMEVAVLTDRSQGGSSLEDGEIELMVHRNSLDDDNLGVSENLNERAFGKPLVARGSHYLMIGPYMNPSEERVAALEKDVAQRKLLEAWTFLSPTRHFTYSQYRKLFKMEYSGLNYALPNNVHILTLEPRGARSLLLRLEHIFEKNEDPYLSKPVTVNLENLFVAFKINGLRETTLGGNQWLDESNPMKFGPQPNYQKDKLKIRAKTNEFEITLNPMQIRTFVVNIHATPA